MLCLKKITGLAVLHVFILGPLSAQVPQGPIKMPERVVSMDPAALLELLPVVPPGEGKAVPLPWKITQSDAYNEYSEKWLIARAHRRYEAALPPAVPTAPPPPPAVIDVRLIDTGYNLPQNALFLSPDGGASAGQKMMVKSFPAIRMGSGDNGAQLFIWIRQRFLLILKGINYPSTDLEKIAQLFPVEKIAAVRDSNEHVVPRPYKLVRVDEIDPRNNSVTEGSYMTDEETEKSFKEWNANKALYEQTLKSGKAPRPDQVPDR